MLEHRGYRIVRYYHEMIRPIPGVVPQPPELPVQPYSAEFEEAVRLAHNDAFSTHWGSIAMDRERWGDLIGSRTFRPDCSFLSLDSDGAVQAYVLVNQWVPGEAWVGLVGTRQRARPSRAMPRPAWASTRRTPPGPAPCTPRWDSSWTR
jgi:hypothetical protein